MKQISGLVQVCLLHVFYICIIASLFTIDGLFATHLYVCQIAFCGNCLHFEVIMGVIVSLVHAFVNFNSAKSNRRGMLLLKLFHSGFRFPLAFCFGMTLTRMQTCVLVIANFHEASFWRYYWSCHSVQIATASSCSVWSIGFFWMLNALVLNFYPGWIHDWHDLTF